MLLVEEECYVSLIGIRIWNYDISLLASGTRLPCASKTIKSYKVFFFQRVSYEDACQHTHVQCAVVRVRAKSILKSVCNVRACGLFSGARCTITFLHIIKRCLALYGGLFAGFLAVLFKSLLFSSLWA